MADPYTAAMEILGITNYSFTLSDLKRAYFKKAIIHHPDKNNNSFESNQMFQEIKDAYEVLTDICIVTDDSMDTDNIGQPEYQGKEITPSEYIDTIINIGIGIVLDNIIQWNGIDTVVNLFITLYTISENVYISDIKLMFLLEQVYEWMISHQSRYTGEYKPTYEYIVAKLQNILHPKKINPCVILRELRPTITDLLTDKIYQLNVKDKTFMVPMWHEEIRYDCGDNTELIVSCLPTLPENVWLDPFYNVYTSVIIDIKTLIIDTPLYVNIGEKTYTIYTTQLTITTKPQTICFYNSGILEINEEAFYKATNRTNVYIQVILI
jgi:hypothetical protein